jgi:hypothetical protein
MDLIKNFIYRINFNNNNEFIKKLLYIRFKLKNIQIVIFIIFFIKIFSIIKN